MLDKINVGIAKGWPTFLFVLLILMAFYLTIVKTGWVDRVPFLKPFLRNKSSESNAAVERRPRILDRVVGLASLSYILAVQLVNREWLQNSLNLSCSVMLSTIIAFAFVMVKAKSGIADRYIITLAFLSTSLFLIGQLTGTIDLSNHRILVFAISCYIFSVLYLAVVKFSVRFV